MALLLYVYVFVKQRRLISARSQPNHAHTCPKLGLIKLIWLLLGFGPPRFPIRIRCYLGSATSGGFLHVASQGWFRVKGWRPLVLWLVAKGALVYQITNRN
ncbi:hypothetical protein TorRG33x02_095810 [Trema orientale]|uniref:Uncharacterized protein n=1 Tax=Trema orientale TaxID=63057 RepID=A0A2P5F9U5_TREOI|nr:hypothetical protein TorRG33x02_095810 [Trema orientale]